jgi:hypothetical protein
MPLFSKKKNVGAQSFVLKLVNNNCPSLLANLEGPRTDSRVNLVVVVLVIPLKNGKLQPQQAFTAVTKEFSGSGVSIVLHRPMSLEHAILGFRFEGSMHFLRAEAKHLDPMGGGFFQLGFQMSEIVAAPDYPELETMGF